MLLATLVVVCLTGALWIVGVSKALIFGTTLAMATVALALLAILMLRGHFNGTHRQALGVLIAGAVPIVIGVTWVVTNSLPPEVMVSLVWWIPSMLAAAVLVPVLIAVGRSGEGDDRSSAMDGWGPPRWSRSSSAR